MEDKRFSLTRVRLTNYKSIASADVSLGNLLFLVGPNGSGKSNFLDALRLTSESLQTSFEQALRSRGGITEIARKRDVYPYPYLESAAMVSFAIDLEFHGPELDGKYGFKVMGGGGTAYISQEYCEIGSRSYEIRGMRGNRPDAFFSVADGQVTGATEPVMPPASNTRLYLVTAAGLDVFRPVFDGLSGISVFNLNPDAIRQPQAADSGEFLHRDASNIASVLDRLQRSKDGMADKARVENYLQQIVPTMRGVERRSLGSWETLEFVEEGPRVEASRRFQAQSVSDGTLRALGVLVALFAGTRDTLSPVGIEEPESALHPAAAGVLLDALRDASERRQVIVTSHSPDLLDRHDFNLAELRAVRSVDGETVIGELDPAGTLALREDLYTPGELLRTDQLLPAKSENTETP